MIRSNSQKSPKDWRDLFTRTIDQIGEDPDRSLIQGEAFTCDRKIGLSLNVRMIASLSSASIRHRVVGAGGALTGYAGGLEMKKILLQIENLETCRGPSKTV